MTTATWTPPTDMPLLFTTSWCPYCAKLKAGLDSRGFAYTELDVEADELATEASEFVKSVNNGNRVVPTAAPRPTRRRPRSSPTRADLRLSPHGMPGWPDGPPADR